MSDIYHYQYAFARPDCRVGEIGPGIDRRFPVELFGDGPIAAVTSRVGRDRFDPERLQAKTAEDIRWLGEVATRHNEIICRAAASSPVLPLRLGTLFCSPISLLASLVCCRATVAEFLEQLGDHQEWGVKLYWDKPQREGLDLRAGSPSPHWYSSRSLGGTNLPHAEHEQCISLARPRAERVDRDCRTGSDYLAQKRAQRDAREELRAVIRRTIQAMHQRLAAQAEQCCCIRTPLGELVGRPDELVFNAAFLLHRSAGEVWMETIENVRRDVAGQRLRLEASGPWPLYHFSPRLELQ